MSPGTYTYDDFVPHVYFTVGTGWEAGHELAEFVDIWHGETTTLGFARPEFVVGKQGHVAVDGLTPQAVVDALASNPYVVSHRMLGVVQVGDKSGPGIEFRTRLGGDLFGGPVDAFHTVESTVLGRIVALVVRGDLVLVLQMSLGPPHEAHQAAIAAVAQTVRFPT